LLARRYFQVKPYRWLSPVSSANAVSAGAPPFARRIGRDPLPATERGMGASVGGKPGRIVRVPGMPSRSRPRRPGDVQLTGQPGQRALCLDQRRRRLRGSDQPVPTPATCRARQASPTSSRLVGENTALVAVLVAFSKNAMAKMMAAAMASIQVPFRVFVREGPVRVPYLLGLGT
jgi:hypothetical protein